MIRALLTAFALLPGVLAAAPVALSLTNAADYIATVPVNSNLIQGVGMGAVGAYRTVRAEDMDFLAEALTERFIDAAEPYPGTTGWTPYDSARVPVAQADIFSTNYYIRAADFRVSLPDSDFGLATPFKPDSSSSDRSNSYGFIPTDWQPWTGVLKMANTNGWVRNGYDAAADIRAVFDSPASDGIPTNTIPQSIVFAGPLSLDAMTNAYAIIEGDLCDAILRGNGPRSDSVTTNVFTTLDGGYYNRFNYTPYRIGSYSGQYLSSVDWLDNYEATTTTYTVVGPTMDCSSRHLVRYVTPYGLEYTTAPTIYNRYPGGILHVSEPHKDWDLIENKLPGTGGVWRVNVGIDAGRDRTTLDVVFNTNLVVDAWLVCCWECRTEDRWTRFEIPEVSPYSSWSSNRVVNLLTSHDLGSMSFATTNAYSDVWQTLNVNVSDVQSAALTWAIALGCFSNRPSFTPVVEEFKILPSEFPGTVTNGWIGANGNTASADAERTHAFSAKHVYLLLRVKPTYRARVLGPNSS